MRTELGSGRPGGLSPEVEPCGLDGFATSIPDAGMIKLHCRTCRRSVEFRRADFPDVPSWVARIEHDMCNICDDGDRSEEHWIDVDGTEPDPNTKRFQP